MRNFKKSNGTPTELESKMINLALGRKVDTKAGSCRTSDTGHSAQTAGHDKPGNTNHLE